MPRTDENGKGLQGLLCYLLDRAVAAKEIYEALGIVRNTYHSRIEEDSFPNAEELRLIAHHFDLNPLDLQVRFGLITAEDLKAFTAAPLAARSTTIKTRPRRLSELSRRADVPAL